MDYIIIDKTSKIPYYIQISDSIKHHINLGVLKHGMQLPTESAICAIFEISVIVVKKAYDDLVQKGLVKRIRGKGTFVNTLKPYVIDLSEGIISINQYLTNAKRTVVGFEKVNHHAFAHTLMNIDPEEYIYIAKTVTSYNNEPILFQYIFLPERYFPDLKKEYIKHKTMFELIVNTYRIEPKGLVQSYRPINLEANIAMMLDLPKGAPGHYIRSYIKDVNENMLAYFTIYGSADQLEFEVKLWLN